ncbi:MAG TPA: TIGR00730 family Rossman fold protein [Sphingomonadales bacterium]
MSRTSRLPRSICVYCGSRPGRDPRLAADAAAFGRTLAEAGITLVYGGGSIGLMGILARSVLEHGGRVIGIIPGHLDHREITQTGLTELHVVGSMHERKRMMFERSDAFVALPGGIGTLDETIEIVTWRQLHLHDKPVILVDLRGYWQPLLKLLDHMNEEGFAGPEVHGLFEVVSSMDEILPALAASPAPDLPDREELL